MSTLSKARTAGAERGTALLMVLWMLIILGVVGMVYSASVQTQLRTTAMTLGRQQAYWAARAGIERARMVVGEEDLSGLTAGMPLLDDEEAYRDQQVGEALFSLIASEPMPGESGTVTYGLSDEGARINVNGLTGEMMAEQPEFSAQMIDGLLDWRDGDGLTRPDGAENEFYLGLENPYPAANTELMSMRELMRVRGWKPVFLRAYPDPYSQFGGQIVDAGAASSLTAAEARGLLERLTTWSVGSNRDPDGGAKLQLGQTNASAMRRRINELTETEAESIEQYAEDEGFESVTDLLDVTEAEEDDDDNNNNQGGRGNQGNRGRGNQGGSGDGREIFSLQRVGEIIDYFTLGQNGGGDGNPRAGGGDDEDEDGDGGGEPTVGLGAINLNTAPMEVLMMVPGMTESMANEIVVQRQGEPFTRAGEIASLGGMTEDLFRTIYPHVGTVATRLRVVSRGVHPESGATATIEAVLDANGADVPVIYWREW